MISGKLLNIIFEKIRMHYTILFKENNRNNNVRRDNHLIFLLNKLRMPTIKL